MIYRAKGIAPDEAHALVDTIMNRNEIALDTLAREELGLDPQTLGSPWVAAGSSFVAFAVGAVLPVIPFLFGSGVAPTIVAAALSVVALFAVGAATSIFTGRHAGRAGLRMAIIGAVVAALTYGIGSLVGHASLAACESKPRANGPLPTLGPTPLQFRGARSRSL